VRRSVRSQGTWPFSGDRGEVFPRADVRLAVVGWFCETSVRSLSMLAVLLQGISHQAISASQELYRS
jgi:hypothetical protein